MWESQCLAAVPVHALCLLLPMEILLALSWIGCHVSEIFLEPWWVQGHNINKAEKEWRAKRGLCSPSPKSIVVLVNYISRYESGNSTRLLEREFHHQQGFHCSLVAGNCWAQRFIVVVLTRSFWLGALLVWLKTRLRLRQKVREDSWFWSISDLKI